MVGAGVVVGTLDGKSDCCIVGAMVAVSTISAQVAKSANWKHVTSQVPPSKQLDSWFSSDNRPVSGAPLKPGLSQAIESVSSIALFETSNVESLDRKTTA